MTVSTSTSRSGPYAGAGTTGPFTVNFRFLDAAHLEVIRTDSTGEHVLVLSTDYSVSGVGNPTGSVTLLAALPSGETLTIIRAVPVTQEADYVQNDDFPAESHENVLDKLTMIAQQHDETIGRSLTLPASASSGVSTKLPLPESNKLIGWNEAANGLQNFDTLALASIVAFGTAKSDLFSGTGAQTTFALTANPGALNNLDVAIGGVTQRPGIDYTWSSGTTLTFTTAPPLGTNNVLARYMQALPQGTSDSAASQFIQSGAGAVTLTVQEELRDRISVKQFGAIGNGVANDTLAIQKADTAAAARGKKLWFPAGTYMADPLTATTSWTAENGAMIKYRGVANVDLVSANGVNYITFEDLIFDGNVSADPGAWSAANYDTFTGATGLTISNCTGARVIRCRAQNTRRHGISLVNCTDSLVESCRTRRSRGNSGDGFFIVSSIGTDVVKCKASDFTRIGLVFDTFGTDPKTSYNINVRDFVAENGHDCSILYGGAEYNAGMWAENCAHVTIDGFLARTISGGSGRGMVLVTGVKNNGVVGNSATFSVSNVRFEATGLGLTAYSLGAFPIAVTVSNVQAYQVYQGVVFVANLAEDTFNCNVGYVDIDFTINPNVTIAYSYEVKPGLASKPNIEFNDCVVRHTSEDLVRLGQYGTTYSCADVGAYIGNPAANGARLTVRNMRSVNGDPVWVGVPNLNQCDLRVSDTYVRIAYAKALGAGSAVLDNCRVRAAALGVDSSARTELYSCTLEGSTQLGGDLVLCKSSRVVLAGADYVWFLTSATGKKPAIILDAVNVEKNLVGGYALRFGFGASTFTALIDNTSYYNTAGTVTANPCLVYAAGSQLLFSGGRKDATATNLADLDSGGAAVALTTGVVAATFH